METTQTYLVLNKCGSPVCVNTRYDSFIIPGGTPEEPGSLPFSLEEILQINSNAPVFKYGVLWFEEEYQKDLYEACRIRDWQSIKSDSDFEEYILHPTADRMREIISIENDFYFERCYGVYIGLKNANYALSVNVDNIMRARRKEIRNKKLKSGIEIVNEIQSPTDIEADKKLAEAEEKNKEMEKQLEEMKKMLQTLMNKDSGDNISVSNISEVETAVIPKTVTKKPSAKKSRSKTTQKV